MADESINCIVTSPPYWGLRDYGLEPIIWDARDGCEHEWGIEKTIITGRHDGDNNRDNRHIGDVRVSEQKASQGQFCLHCGAWLGSLGLEPTPELYVKHLVDIFRECGRVLKKDGTLWLNLGDSYNSHSTGQGGVGGIEGKRKNKSDNTANTHRGKLNLKNKNLVGIPWRVAFALQADGWYLRQDIIWAKPNPMPESVTDRCTKSHEYLFLLSKSAKYYFDAEAIKEPANYDGRKDEIMKGSDKYANGFVPNQASHTFHQRGHERWQKNKEGLRVRNKRSVWTISSHPFKGAHFATFPEKLVEPCILAGCPKDGIVLDLFIGSGTVAVVAEKLCRNWLGVELNPAYIEMAKRRLVDVQKKINLTSDK